MAIMGTNNPSIMDKLVAEAAMSGFALRQNKWQEVFRQYTPERLNEKFTIIKLDNNVTETTDGGAFTPSNVNEIGGKTITQRIYKDSVNTGDFAEAFDYMNAIADAAREKADDYKYKMDQIAADFLNNYSSTTGQYGFIVDGTTTKIALAGNTQPIGNTGSTQDTLIAGGWSKTNLKSARDAMTKMKKHNGNVAGYSISKIVHPVELAQSIYEDTVSKIGPTADNNANFANSLNIQRVEWDLLTSATTLFLLDDRAKKYYVYCIKQSPSVERIKRQSTGNMEYQYKMMLAAGIYDYQGTVVMTA